MRKKAVVSSMWELTRIRYGCVEGYVGISRDLGAKLQVSGLFIQQPPHKATDSMITNTCLTLS